MSQSALQKQRICLLFTQDSEKIKVFQRVKTINTVILDILINKQSCYEAVLITSFGIDCEYIQKYQLDSYTANLIPALKCFMMAEAFRWRRLKHTLHGPSLQRASLVAQMVKHLPEMWETRVQSLGQEDPLEKEMATHSSTLAWKIPWIEELGKLQSKRLQRVGHDFTFTFTFHFLQPPEPFPWRWRARGKTQLHGKRLQKQDKGQKYKYSVQ